LPSTSHHPKEKAAICRGQRCSRRTVASKAGRVRSQQRARICVDVQLGEGRSKTWIGIAELLLR
ncbi:MAG: hypothetical protein M3198_14330, partial [Actinomycetota bacterium]|nr:hypothetical protein [Actinomycetota bacterium]